MFPLQLRCHFSLLSRFFLSLQFLIVSQWYLLAYILWGSIWFWFHFLNLQVFVCCHIVKCSAIISLSPVPLLSSFSSLLRSDVTKLRSVVIVAQVSDAFRLFSSLYFGFSDWVMFIVMFLSSRNLSFFLSIFLFSLLIVILLRLLYFYFLSIFYFFDGTCSF